MKAIKFILKVISVIISLGIGSVSMGVYIMFIDKFSTDNASDPIYAFVATCIVIGIIMYLTVESMFNLISKLD